MSSGGHYDKAGIKRKGMKGEYSHVGEKTTPPMGKEVKDSAKEYAKGGAANQMFGRQMANTKVPGNTGHDVEGSPGQFIKGGSTKMFGKGSASPMPAGQTGKNQN
jgi:hypothetical protein